MLNATQWLYSVPVIVVLGAASGVMLWAYERRRRQRPRCRFCGASDNLIQAAGGTWVCADWRNCEGVAVKEF